MLGRKLDEVLVNTKASHLGLPVPRTQTQIAAQNFRRALPPFIPWLEQGTQPPAYLSSRERVAP